MTDTSTYGRTLDFQGSAAECPPEDIYTFLISDVDNPVERAGFNDGDTDIQVTVHCLLEGYEYDEDDPDDFDWNGTLVKTFVKIGAIYAKERERAEKADEAPRPSPVWKSERSSAYPFMQAVFPEWDFSKEGLRSRALPIDDMIGRRFRASLAPNKKGYASLSNYIKAKAKTARPKLVKPVIEDDEDDDLLNAE